MPAPRADLRCDVVQLSYDFDKRVGRLDIAANQACDLGGCSRLFEAIDPHVEYVEVFSGGKSDGIYRRGPHGWDSVITR